MKEQTNTSRILNVVKHPIIAIKKGIHPLLLSQMPSKREFELRKVNELPQIDGPVLYLATHATSHDAPVLCEFIKEHSYIMIGKQPMNLIDRIFFYANGEITIDRDDKNSCKKGSNKIVKLLGKGVPVAMFPERTWCVKPSTPINHCAWGWVDIIKKVKKEYGIDIPVVPIALEYYELTDNCCYLNAGKPIYVNEFDDKALKNAELEDTFASLKHEIWNQFPTQSRNQVDEKIWDKTMEHRYSEYPKLDKEKEDSYIMGNDNDPEYVLNSEEFTTGVKKLEKVYGKFM